MFKLLIVDDEPAIREGLQTLVDWERHGFRVAGLGVDGEDGLRQFRELRPDLVVVDIRMPRRSGLELVEEIRRLDSACRVLVLSGHADFAYAQQAIRLGIEGYLLKPVDEEELEAYAERISLALREERREARGQAEEAGREAALLALLDGEDGALAEAAAGSALAGGSGPWRALLVEPPDGGAARLEQLRERLSAHAGAAGLGPVARRAGAAVLLVPGGEAGLRAARRLLEEALAEEGCTAALGADAGAGELARSCREAEALLRHRFVLEPDLVHERLPEPLEARLEPGGARGPLPGPEATAQLAKRLAQAVETGNAERVRETLEEAAWSFAAADSSRPAAAGAMAELCGLTLSELASSIDGFAPAAHAGLAAGVYRQDRLGGLLAELERQLAELSAELDAGDSGSVLRRMLAYMERHYSEPLRLEMLAGLYGYNSGYLGKLFKSHTGLSFNAYLDQLRIERAIAMLEGGMKVRQAAEKVGYGNVDYFHAKFKKATGMPPSAYKKSAGSGSGLSGAPRI
ncbi:response regulator [Paenibacillus albicereus]|uniref:Response regulator n=1 Tax=Paenibacillus albicereus TaxID=2726185 RepID=A0A6H2H1Z0_9BACL|nr:response regulator [Paenibacillus albicereus]QJC53690.1 response regulator [Paenibacillus albicereus]